MLQAQIFMDKDELFNSQPLFEYIMQFLLLNHIKGATVFKGMMGFGEKKQVQRPENWFSFDEPPMMITFIDEAPKVLEVLKKLRQQYTGGFIITNSVDFFEA